MLRTIRQQRWDSRHIAMASGYLPTNAWREKIVFGAGTPVQLCRTGIPSETLRGMIAAYLREPHRKPGTVFGEPNRVSNQGKRNEEIAVAGVTSGGGFSRDSTRAFWDGIDDQLRDAAARCLGLYMGTASTHVPGLRGDGTMRDEVFRVKHYANGTRERAGGFHDWHVDDLSPSGVSSRAQRRMALILYLNQVKIGGETEIRGFEPITPQAGQMLLFPTGQGFVHRGREPLSEPKFVVSNFIIT